MAKKVEQQIEELINSVLWDKGINLVRWELKGDSILRIFIDKPGGVTVDDCAIVSRELSALLDIEKSLNYYRLEVSSPGIG